MSIRTSRRPRASSRGAARRSRGSRTTRSTVGRARSHLRRYRKATLLAVALTGFLFLLFPGDGPGRAQDPGSVREVPDSVSIIQQISVEDLSKEGEDSARNVRPDSISREATREATRTLRDLWYSAIGLLPKLGIALGIFIVAWILVRLLRPLLTRMLGEWERADAFTALFGIGIWVVALGVSLSVVAGDMRALLGSLGLIGLALSWALQAPIESFTGWVLNSLRGYYRIGDRIAVGDVFGDVYRVDMLTTTVWEYGGVARPPGSVRAEQPTGRLITFPNNEVLTGTIINYTRDFPFVWDELMVEVGPETDLRYAMEVIGGVAAEIVGEQMCEPARLYQAILLRAGLKSTVAEEPQLFISLTESGAGVTIRYLVGAREKRRWKSELSLRVLEEIGRPENLSRIHPFFPRRQIQIIGADGAPAWLPLERRADDDEDG